MPKIQIRRKLLQIDTNDTINLTLIILIEKIIKMIRKKTNLKRTLEGYLEKALSMRRRFVVKNKQINNMKLCKSHIDEIINMAIIMFIPKVIKMIKKDKTKLGRTLEIYLKNALLSMDHIIAKRKRLVYKR